MATGQLPDILVWDGDTLDLLCNPLEERQDADTIRAKVAASASTACHRGYIAVFTLAGGELFLTSLYDCSYKPLKVGLKELFGDECHEGKVKAAWVTGSLHVVQGKMIHYAHAEYHRYHETDILLELSSGNLVNIQRFSNTGSYSSVFAGSTDTLQAFIYSGIDWKKIPVAANAKVVLRISSGAHRKPFVELARPSSCAVCDEEALRVLRQLPEWNVYYRFGEAEQVRWLIPVVFDETKRGLYAQ